MTQFSQAGNPKRQLSNSQAGPTASSTPLLLNAQMQWGGHPLCGRPAGYLPPGTVGQWPPATLQWRTESRAATRKPTRRGRLGPRAGIPKRKLPNCQKNKKVLSYQRGLHQHTAKGRDPRTPASWRHLLMRVVAATAGMLRVDGRTPPFRARRGVSCSSTLQILWVLHAVCVFNANGVRQLSVKRRTYLVDFIHFFVKVLSLRILCLAQAQHGASSDRCRVSCSHQTMMCAFRGLLRIWKCSIMKFHW